MSHANVTITRTVGTSHPSAIFLNVGYLKSASGLLKLAQLVLGGIVIGLILGNDYYYSGRYDIRDQYYPNLSYIKTQWTYYSPVATLFMLVISVTFFICTFILLLSCIFSLSTGTLISKTLYEFIYHMFAAILMFIASVAAFAQISGVHFDFQWYWNITIICFVNFVLYLISTILAFREYRY